MKTRYEVSTARCHHLDPQQNYFYLRSHLKKKKKRKGLRAEYKLNIVNQIWLRSCKLLCQVPAWKEFKWSQVWIPQRGDCNEVLAEKNRTVSKSCNLRGKRGDSNGELLSKGCFKEEEKAVRSLKNNVMEFGLVNGMQRGVKLPAWELPGCWEKLQGHKATLMLQPTAGDHPVTPRILLGTCSQPTTWFQNGKSSCNPAFLPAGRICVSTIYTYTSFSLLFSVLTVCRHPYPKN